jgi:gliding motility-associated-like protein
MRTTIILSLLFWFSIISSQTIISENTVFTIAINSILATNHDITNYGALSNDGSIELEGNWDNNGTYNELQGRIILNGDEIQNLSHNNQKIYYLEINGGAKQVGEDVTITGTLNLLNGIVTPDNNVRIVVNDGAQIISASGISYINGALYHSGTGQKFFPIGKNGNYEPVELVNIQGDKPIVGLELFEPNPNPQAGPGIRQVSTERYWKKTILSGEITNMQIKCENPDLQLFNNISNVVYAQAEQVSGVFSSIGGRNVGGSLISELSFSENIVTFAELGSVEITNVITPNNDGINDYLTISNLELFPENELLILNMMGQVIYSMKNYNNTWDATIDNKPLPQGNYMCILKLKNSNKIYKQTISILR